MTTSGPPALLDVHHLGLRQTGNETWANNIVEALESDGGAAPHYALTSLGAAALPVPVEPARLHLVAGSSLRRLTVDLPRLVHRLRPEALLVQYTAPPTRVPTVVVIHDLSFESPQARAWLSSTTLLRYRSTIRSSARRAAAILVATQWTRADLLARYRVEPDRVLVCPITVDVRLEQALANAAALRNQAPDPGGNPVVLCVGGVLPRKNLPVVAAAVARLRAEGLPGVLRVVGGIPDAGRADAARLSELLGDAVSFAGYVDTATLVEEYARASVLCYPSRFEGFGIPLLEAMAAAVPVISSNATCLPEVGGDAALFADPDDVEAWSAALRSVLDDAELRTRMAERGRQRVAAYRPAAAAAAVRAGLALAAGSRAPAAG